MVGLTSEFVVWLIFSKYSFQKTVSYFLGLEQDFENDEVSVFKIYKMFLMT